jgi:hypothetical protein
VLELIAELAVAERDDDQRRPVAAEPEEVEELAEAEDA